MFDTDNEDGTENIEDARVIYVLFSVEKSDYANLVRLCSDPIPLSFHTWNGELLDRWGETERGNWIVNYVVKVVPDELARWCSQAERPLDAEARRDYIKAKLVEREGIRPEWAVRQKIIPISL
ncbi:MAG TPA: hypothetical protein VGO22_07095 [Pseudorhizobium sp.]|jgi:hypothetical protein|nr:hypothetical protein [Pseudorhizobium sp.]